MMQDGKESDRGPEVPPPLRRALESARQGHKESMDSLRDAVCAYVDQLKSRDLDATEIRVAVLDAIDKERDGREREWGSELFEVIITSCDQRPRE